MEKSAWVRIPLRVPQSIETNILKYKNVPIKASCKYHQVDGCQQKYCDTHRVKQADINEQELEEAPKQWDLSQDMPHVVFGLVRIGVPIQGHYQGRHIEQGEYVQKRRVGRSAGGLPEHYL